VLARHCAMLDSPHPREQAAIRLALGPVLPVAGIVVLAIGLALCVGLTLQWGRSGFGALDPEVAMRQIIPGVSLALIGTLSLLASVFFSAMRSAFDSSRLASGRSAGTSEWSELTA